MKPFRLFVGFIQLLLRNIFTRVFPLLQFPVLGGGFIRIAVDVEPFRFQLFLDFPPLILRNGLVPVKKISLFPRPERLFVKVSSALNRV